MQHNQLCHVHVEGEGLLLEVALLVSKIEAIAKVVFGTRLNDEEMTQLLAELALEVSNV